MLTKITEDLYIDLEKIIYFSSKEAFLILKDDKSKIFLTAEQSERLKTIFTLPDLYTILNQVKGKEGFRLKNILLEKISTLTELINCIKNDHFFSMFPGITKKVYKELTEVMAKNNINF